MRERIEDLGRILVMAEKLLEHALFQDENRPGRPKDSVEWWIDKSSEEQHDAIHNICYGIRDVEEAILEILEIAKGWDVLNEKSDE